MFIPLNKILSRAKICYTELMSSPKLDWHEPVTLETFWYFLNTSIFSLHLCLTLHLLLCKGSKHWDVFAEIKDYWRNSCNRMQRLASSLLAIQFLSLQAGPWHRKTRRGESLFARIANIAKIFVWRPNYVGRQMHLFTFCVFLSFKFYLPSSPSLSLSASRTCTHTQTHTLEVVSSSFTLRNAL